MRIRRGTDQGSEGPRDGRGRWLTRERIGVTLIWMVIIASLVCIFVVGRAVMASGECECEGSGGASLMLWFVAGS